ncbi:HicB family protein [Sinorhizobium meliloti]|uniref:type II toxin-antitoxin system HicB family antitoxin n=1 Tax=Rhizobium meliloti TaxID=382 RepID=UPI000FD5603F|nr:type II toxin-antitoxin system HicB family antitoxin [Sinorhizobium meliloti]RVH13727.1 HicB family protein [Sinorhizobium meliloti]RVK52165.1 HicB family protein [Sinorhizobium meliloti]
MTGQRTETEMARFFALLDGHDGAYGVAFPDAPGATAMGKTVDEALRNAAAAIADWIDDGEVPEPRSIDELRQDPEVAEQLADGAAFVVVPAIVEDSRPVKANISMEAGLLAAIDEAASSAGLTRSAFLVTAAREKIFGGSLRDSVREIDKRDAH